MDNIEENSGVTQNIDGASECNINSTIKAQCTNSARPSPPKASDSSSLQMENLPENNESSHREFGALEDKKENNEVIEPSKPALEINEIRMLKEINEPSSSSQSVICSLRSETGEKIDTSDGKERKPLQVIWQNLDTPLDTPLARPGDMDETPFRPTIVQARQLQYPDPSSGDEGDEESASTELDNPVEKFNIWHDSF